MTCRPHVAPPSAQSVVVQVTLEKSTYELLCYARQLLSHQIPSGDLPQVIDRAFRALVRELEKVRFAATGNPRAAQAKPIPGSRHIPHGVRRVVWERDRGQCTYVSDAGHRCESREFIEFDHVQPFAHGGDSTVENLRLRCRAHNQLGAEVTYGTGFMQAKRRTSMSDGSRGTAA